jgi:enolase
MIAIKDFHLREIIDSHGRPALEAGLSSADRFFWGSAPNSDSDEGLLFRDKENKRYRGEGLTGFLRQVEGRLRPGLPGRKFSGQEEFDSYIKEALGEGMKAATFAFSAAFARLSADSSKQELFVYLQQSFSLAAPSFPRPIFNIFDGGAYADTNLDFQEFLLVPKAGSFSESLRCGVETYRELAHVLRESGYDSDVGSEGGYAPDLESSIEAIELIMAAAIRVGYQAGRDFHLGLDIASSLLYESSSHKYIFSLDGARLGSADLISLYNDWLAKYPLLYLEDALADDDWASWNKLTAELGNRLLIAGDSLFASSADRLRQGLKEKAANTVVIKPILSGTLTDAVNCIILAKKHGYKIVLSQEIGETNDDLVSDLAVALSADFFKAGSLSRGERVGKYNRLLAISELLGNS